MATCTVTGQEALLLWCKLNTTGYNNVKVHNFHTSWKDGLAMCALIHKFHPEILQFETLSKDKPLDNLEVAFSLAAKLGIPRLLDPDDMMIEPKPDQRSVTTYLSQMYHVFQHNDHPGKGIAGVTMAASLNTNENSSEFENILVQDQVSAKPKLQRSLSTSILPKHTPGSSSNLSLQKRTGPPLLTKGSIPKFTPPSKTAPSSPTTPASAPALAAAPVPTPAPASPIVSQSKAPEVPTPTPSATSPIPISPVTPIRSASPASYPIPIPRKSASSPDISASVSGSSNSSSINYKLSSAPVVSSSAPVSFPRSVTSPSISIASLLSLKTAPDSKTDEPATPQRIINSTRSPSSGASPTHSPSPSPTPPSPSPSPTPQDNKKSKLGTKSAPSHVVKGEESDEEKVQLPQKLSSRSHDRQTLKRTLSGQNWVQKIKANTEFIQIDGVEIKKVKELEGPLKDDDDEAKKPNPSPTKSFMVDKPSSSSRESWLRKRQAVQEEEEDEYEYVDNDPNRIHEPPSLSTNFKLEPCLLRSSSTGKLTMPIPTLTRGGSLKKVSFKENYSPSVETIQEEIKLVQVEVQEIVAKDKVGQKNKDVQAKETLKDSKDEQVSKAPQSPGLKDENLVEQGSVNKGNLQHSPVLSNVPQSPSLPPAHVPARVPQAPVQAPTQAPAQVPVQTPAQAPAQTLQQASTQVAQAPVHLASTQVPATTSHTPTPGSGPTVFKELERERDAAIFCRDEIAAKYAELEVKLKEERAANDAMERETAELHQKLAAVQNQVEAKFAQQLAEMNQKLVDKDREILRLRMQNTMNKKKVEEKERDLERLKIARSFSPPPELASAEDLESENECRKVWENAEKETPSKSVVHPYGGLKVSYETKPMLESPRSSTASPRVDSAKNHRMSETPESPFSPDLNRRTLAYKVGMSPMSPTSPTSPIMSPMSPIKPSESPDFPIEIAKVTYTYIRPHTPTKPGDTKLGAQHPSSRPQTPTKVEIKPKPPAEFKRQDSLSRITVHIPSPKSPEPVKVVLSPKAPPRSESTFIGGSQTSATDSNKSCPESSPPSASSVKPGNTTPRESPGTPRTTTEVPAPVLDPKLPKLDDLPTPKPEYRPGTLRTEVSKPSITFSPPGSPIVSPRPSPAPSPASSPAPSPSHKIPVTKSFHVRHNSNPHSPSPTPNPPQTSPRRSSNPSPSQSPSPSSNVTSSVAKHDTRGATIPSSKSEHTSKASALFSFITRGRSNTLPTEPEKARDPEPVAQSPRGGLKIEVGQAKESTEDEEVLNREGPQRIMRSYSLSSLMPPKLSSTPSYIPTGKQAEVKPAWLVNLTKKAKEQEVNSILHDSKH